MKKFTVKFQIYTKVIKVDEFPLVYDEIKRVFSFLKRLPENFIVNYEDKDLGYVDLDCPIELANRKSDILLVESELSGKIVNTSMPNYSHNTSSDGSFSG